MSIKPGSFTETSVIDGAYFFYNIPNLRRVAEDDKCQLPLAVPFLRHRIGALPIAEQLST